MVVYTYISKLLKFVERPFIFLYSYQFHHSTLNRLQLKSLLLACQKKNIRSFIKDLTWATQIENHNSVFPGPIMGLMQIQDLILCWIKTDFSVFVSLPLCDT